MAKTAIRMIPLNKLVASTRNVRATSASETDDAELYASIRHSGLKQNLLVHEGEDGLFHVHAGGRRLKALQKLAEDGHIKADEKIACRVETGDIAEESSTIENMVRSAMHPADEFAAFAALIDRGQSIDDVALKFGVPASRVEKRLKLARVAPAILDKFRAGEITLECVMAFTLTDDHKRQVALWEQIVASYYQPSPATIRRMLMDTATAGGSKHARFVGREAYEAAGGTVTEDLFSDRDSIYFEDAALLERLVNEKLEAAAEELRGQSWKWAEVRLDHQPAARKPRRSGRE